MKYLLVSLWLFGLSLLQGCGGEIVSSTTATPPSPPASLAITSSTPPSGTAGAAYAGSGFLLTASGGVAPYQWKWVPASGSSLPEPDLHLSSSGLISGTLAACRRTPGVAQVCLPDSMSIQAAGKSPVPQQPRAATASRSRSAMRHHHRLS